MSVLAINALHVRYRNGAHAVRGVDLVIGTREVVALVGESGCGKSSIANAIVGIHPRGTRVDGMMVLQPTESGGEAVDLLSLSESAWRSIRGRRIGYVAQNPYRTCDPLRSVGHHIVSAWRVHRKRPDPGEVEGAVGRLGIADPARQLRLRPHQWSGGMLQRASIAAGQALTPQLLIADEPTSALDAELARGTLQVFIDGSASVLLVTHDLTLAKEVADTVAVIYGGSIVERGSAAQVMAAPRHPYTRALLAAVPRSRGVLPTALPGSPPNPLSDVSGCVFAPRCPHVVDRCRVEVPIAADGVACHREEP